MILNIIIAIVFYIVGRVIGYSKGKDQYKIYKNIIEQQELKAKPRSLYENTVSGALHNDRLDDNI
jgi:hypothetical protein|tara:strand:+ start:1780 stop:1974 length:195 start_codon:yes stop_codon:yes gene_type:complete